MPARKVPARPLPGELAVLDSITTLHFRKVAVSASTDSLPKIHPEIVGMGDQLTPESLLAGDFLQGSKLQTTPHLQVSGVQSLLAGQSMLNGSGLDHLSLLTGGATISAWSTSRLTNAVLHSFNKYSKVTSSATSQHVYKHHNHILVEVRNPTAQVQINDSVCTQMMPTSML